MYIGNFIILTIPANHILAEELIFHYELSVKYSYGQLPMDSFRREITPLPYMQLSVSNNYSYIIIQYKI